MNRYLTLALVAFSVFVLGTIAGRLILTSGTSQSPLPAKNGSLAIRPVVGPQVSADSDEQFADDEVSPNGMFTNAPVAFASLPVELAASDPASEAETRNAILQHYPDLDENTLQGWVDSYRDVSVPELQALLEEKQRMADAIADVMPSGSFLHSVSTSEYLDEKSADDREGFQVAKRCLQHNLRNVFTPGFRRRTICTTPLSISAHDAANLRVLTEFDCRPATIRPSHNPLHLAIKDDGTHWFSLDDGRLLTRHGAFVRLQNGQLGLVGEDGTEVALVGCAIPAAATDIIVAADGTITAATAHDSQQRAGKIKVVSVANGSQLQSENGVFFELCKTQEPAQPTSFRLLAGHLEASNANAAEELQLLQHIQHLRQP